MRHLLIAIAVSIVFFPAIPAHAQVSVSIGINVPAYPELVQVPGYPVYYAPQVNSNYFFYGGQYWVYQRDNWYASSWYNGPWQLVQPTAVPLFILRIPVRYYRQPPPYFDGWQATAPPHWGQHWGPQWAAQRRGWDQWNHRAVPRAAPLPIYQRQYSGERYPHTAEQQKSLRTEHYRYQPARNGAPAHSQTRGNSGHAGPSPSQQHAPANPPRQQSMQQRIPPSSMQRAQPEQRGSPEGREAPHGRGRGGEGGERGGQERR